jgi:mono/diheme cytochrome c family protein
MIWRRMNRSLRVPLLAIAAVAVAVLASACGTEHIGVAQSNPLYRGAVLFSQRCSGCHTLSYAATHGSAPNIRTAQANSGPNLDSRCERPITRVLYAVENGGFSGAYMPQNIVVGPDAVAVAEFVATYAGRGAPKLTGIVPCPKISIGTLPAPTATTAASATTATTAASATTATTAVASATTATIVTTLAAAPVATAASGKQRHTSRGKRKHASR